MPRATTLVRGLLLCGAVMLAHGARAHDAIPPAAADPMHAHDESTPPSHDANTRHDAGELGVVHFPVSCSAAAQTDFERAVALLHHMTYPEARVAFGALAAREPTCAMAGWGIAMTLFQPLWPTRPSAADLAAGREALAAARRARAPTARERAFIAAADAFYDDRDSPTYWQRLARWERAMQQLHGEFPSDPEATVFYALAHLAVAPADARARNFADDAAELLLPVYRANPRHPGAMHYVVHANDVPGRERQLLDIVRKYETVAPRNPHALHMPTHIYTRLGAWDDSIRGNVRAAEAALETPAGDRGQYVWDEFPHAIEYLVYAYLQQGNDVAAQRELQRLHDTPRLEPSFKTAFHLASTSARYALERGDWGGAARLVPREPATLDWGRFPWAEAVTWFAVGVGAAHGGDAARADAAAERLATLEAGTHASGELLFEKTIRVLKLGVLGWSAQAKGDAAGARARLTEAAELEAATPKHAVTPGPTLPAYEMLGDLLLEQHLAQDARSAYERSLQMYPERFRSLLGAARAAKAGSDRAAAAEYYRHLLRVGSTSTRADVTAEAQAALAAR